MTDWNKDVHNTEGSNMGKKTSIVWKIGHEEFQKLLDESSSVIEILKKIGFKDQHNGNHRTLNKRIHDGSFNLSMFKGNCENRIKGHFLKLSKLVRTSDDAAFSENSTLSRSNLKNRIIAGKYKPYICSECQNAGEHNGKKLKLQLDHINGIAADNRLENLRFLCPNCHSQTSNFSGKKAKRFNKCKRCMTADVTVKNNRKYCDNCLKVTSKEKNKRLERFSVDKLELEKLIQEIPMTKIGEMFGVSDNAIRKRCKSFNIELPKNRRGYWVSKKI